MNKNRQLEVENTVRFFFQITPKYKHHKWITGTEVLGKGKAPRMSSIVETIHSAFLLLLLLLLLLLQLLLIIIIIIIILESRSA